MSENNLEVSYLQIRKIYAEKIKIDEYVFVYRDGELRNFRKNYPDNEFIEVKGNINRAWDLSGDNKVYFSTIPKKSIEFFLRERRLDTLLNGNIILDN